MSEMTERQVIQYLQTHSEFFANNPKLLNALTVANPQGEVVNLADRKMLQLQEKNKQLTVQLKQLVNNAQRNEGLMNRLFQLLIELSMNAPKELFVTALVSFIKKDFPSDYFQLLLADISFGEDDSQISLYTAEQRQLFAGFVNNSTPLSGRLPELKMRAIFGNGSQVRSAIVLPIGTAAEHGLMAFGSDDEHKFHPDLASDVLQKLVHILAAYIDGQINGFSDQQLS